MEESDPKHRHIKFGCQRITRMKEYSKHEVYFNVGLLSHMPKPKLED